MIAAIAVACGILCNLVFGLQHLLASTAPLTQLPVIGRMANWLRHTRSWGTAISMVLAVVAYLFLDGTLSVMR